MNRLEISSIKIGMRFSKPVFFDDGKNMFIESDISVKPYHIASLSKWRIPFLLTEGHVMIEGEKLEPEIEEIPSVDEELEEISEIEEL